MKITRRCEPEGIATQLFRFATDAAPAQVWAALTSADFSARMRRPAQRRRSLASSGARTDSSRATTLSQAHSVSSPVSASPGSST